MMRPTTSIGPPAANGTTMLTPGRVGQGVRELVLMDQRGNQGGEQSKEQRVA